MYPIDSEANKSTCGCESSSKWGSSRPPVSPFTVTRYPAGSLHFSSGPREVTQSSLNTTLVLPPMIPPSLSLQPDSLKLQAFTPHEIEKILADSKLRELLLSDPKKVKRILGNRESAARSKKKKKRRITDLEEEVKVLNNEKASMSSKIIVLEEKLKVLMNANKQLTNQNQTNEQVNENLTKHLLAEIQSLNAKLALNEQMTLEIQQATGEQMQNLDQFDTSNMFHQPHNDQFNGYLDQFDTSNMFHQHNNNQQQTNPDNLDQFDTSNMFHQPNNDQLNGYLDQLDTSSMFHEHNINQQQTNPGYLDPFDISNMFHQHNNDQFNDQQQINSDLEYMYPSF